MSAQNGPYAPASARETASVRVELVVNWPLDVDVQELVDAVPSSFTDRDSVISVEAEVPCRVCGCTDERACTSPLGVSTCGWAEQGLCTFCAQRAERQREAGP
jgi:hypothetical protein